MSDTPILKQYDSAEDTNRHKEVVKKCMDNCIMSLCLKSVAHDDSKLLPPEKAIFDEFTPKLRGSTYGSKEYMGFLASMKAALDHHYSVNSHHPENHLGGIDGMTLLDLIEMLCDWKAAGQRHADGSMADSLVKSKDRFKIGHQLHQILENTAREMQWL